MLTNKQEIRFFTFLGVVLFILLVVSFIFGHQIERGALSSPAKLANDPFAHLTLTAHAVYVYDIRADKVLFEKNANERMPLASLTKVMTGLVATGLAPSYSTVTITKEAISTDGDSGLKVGEKWTLKNLLAFSLTSSSNDGARAVALALGALNDTSADTATIENDFIKDMNKKADELGMKNTYFFNDTGLDVSDQKGGAYGTAKDMSTLFSFIMKNDPDFFSATRVPVVRISSVDHTIHIAKNTDLIVDSIPGLKASKTGFTDLAGGNLVIAFDPEIGHPIVISVLGSSEDGRFTDMIKLVNATIKEIQK